MRFSSRNHWVVIYTIEFAFLFRQLQINCFVYLKPSFATGNLWNFSDSVVRLSNICCHLENGLISLFSQILSISFMDKYLQYLSIRTIFSHNVPELAYFPFSFLYLPKEARSIFLSFFRILSIWFGSFANK